MSRYAVHLENVQKKLGRFRLDIPELALERGYVLGLIGRNGAGKTTTLNVLLNLIHPDTGRVSVLGMEQPKAETEIRRRVGYLSETPLPYGDLTLGWLGRMLRRLYPTWDDGLYRHYLAKFDLDDRKKVRQLSRGMKVKAGLLLALSHAPELLVLDEPTSGADPVVRRELLKEIVDVIRDEGRTVILSSHITQDIEQVADFVAIIDEGRIVVQSDKEDLLGRWRRVTGRLGKAVPDSDGLFVDFRAEGSTFSALTDRFSDEWLRQVEGSGFEATRVQPVGLDEILERVAKGGGQA